jgi:hypothetical protein
MRRFNLSANSPLRDGHRGVQVLFWERSGEGVDWEPWMDITFTRSE